MTNKIDGDLRTAVLDMDKAMGCLRYELAGEVWDDVHRRWQAVRSRVVPSGEPTPLVSSS